MSNIFISIIHCPWLLSYLIISIIGFLGLPWYYPYFYCYYLYINYIINFYSLNYWIRDSIREYTSIYISFIIMMSVAFYVLIFSESLFFITFFWSSFHILCSSIWSLEGIYLSDPSELAFTNIILLSNSSLSLGNTLIIRETHILRTSTYQSFLLGLTFISMQIKEFCNITLYMNESIYSCVFFSLTGLHLFHVVVGILLIGLILLTSYYSRSIINFILLQLRVSPHHLYYILQLVYWHFIELLWLFIYYILYI